VKADEKKKGEINGRYGRKIDERERMKDLYLDHYAK